MAELTQSTLGPDSIETGSVATESSTLGSTEPHGLGTTGYDEYFMDAQDRNHACAFAYQQWTRSHSTGETSSVHEASGTRNNRSTFVSIVLQQLRSSLSHSFAKNLLVTSIINKIVHLPDLAVQEMLFKRPDTEGLIAALTAVSNEASALCQSRAIYDDRLKAALKLGVSNYEEIIESLEPQVGSDLPKCKDPSAQLATETVTADSTAMPRIDKFIPAYLLLSEFCKEVAATVLVVKTSMVMLRIVKQSSTEFEENCTVVVAPPSSELKGGEPLNAPEKSYMWGSSSPNVREPEGAHDHTGSTVPDSLPKSVPDALVAGK
jgi:hypothetical protein